MKKLAVFFVLISTQAFADSWQLNRITGQWALYRKEASVMPTDTGFLIHFHESLGKCYAYPSNPLKALGIEAKGTCSGNLFTVTITKGIEKEPFSPDLLPPDAFFMVAVENENGGQVSDPKLLTPSKPEPKKEPRIPNKW